LTISIDDLNQFKSSMDIIFKSLDNIISGLFQFYGQLAMVCIAKNLCLNGNWNLAQLFTLVC
jgi:hypothetical protein